jgi:hypothetical protein
VISEGFVKSLCCGLDRVVRLLSLQEKVSLIFNQPT